MISITLGNRRVVLWVNWLKISFRVGLVRVERAVRSV